MPLIDDPDIRAIFDEAMRQRAARNLPSQTLNETSCKIAQDWAEHMASVGKLYHGGGEHIVAWHSSSQTSAAQGVNIWMGSSGHRAWILGKARLCGFGIARSRFGTYWAGRFEALNPSDPGNPAPGPAPNQPPSSPTPQPHPPRRRRFLDWLLDLFR